MACSFCTNEATLLCDYTIGFVGKGELVRISDEHATCDAPICNQCSTRKGVIFYSPGGPDTIDHCPYHSAYDIGWCRSITAGEAEQERLRAWKLKSV